MTAAVKVDLKQEETKKLVVVSYTFSQGYLLSKLEMKCKRGNILDLILVGIPSSLILSVKILVAQE